MYIRPMEHMHMQIYCVLYVYVETLCSTFVHKQCEELLSRVV